MAKMQSGMPAQKVMGGTIGAAVAALLVSMFPTQIPEEAKIPLITIITFIVGYFIPPSAVDGVEASTNDLRQPARAVGR